MVLDKLSMQMAKSLARDLVRIQKEMKQRSIKDSFNELKHRVIEAWESIKSFIGYVFQAIFVRDNEHESKKNKPSKNWYVPLNIKAPPMPYLKVPHFFNARSNI